MSMVGDLLWWGALGPGPGPLDPLNIGGSRRGLRGLKPP